MGSTEQISAVAQFTKIGPYRKGPLAPHGVNPEAVGKFLRWWVNSEGMGKFYMLIAASAYRAL